MSESTNTASGLMSEPKGRERWPSRTSFIMAAIGSAVGLGNLWRFPAVAYANGGGAFFIPYFVALITAGIPLLILEFSVGQMMQGSAPKSLGKLNRNFKWVGWLALLVGTLISTYYAIIMAYSWSYLGFSLSGASWSAAGAGSEAEFFFTKYLKMSTAPGEWWHIQPSLIIGLALTWIAVYFIIHKGVHRVGKIVMWTVPLPWVILMILALRGLTLPGASTGVEYYLKPDWSALSKGSTWLAAYGQIFFSLTIGFGVMIAYASFRPKDSDVTNNAFITSFANCLTSFFAGFAVFSVLGFLAFKNGLPVGSVVKGGPGLAFIVYPAAISKLGDFGALWPPLIGFLFFAALLMLGIDSLFSLVEAIGAGLHDRYKKINRERIVLFMCIFGFLGGLIFTTRAGLAFLDLFDNWANNYGLPIVGLLQCLLIGYFVKGNKVRAFANKVSEIKLTGWWDLCVRVVTPAVLAYLLSSQFLQEFVEPYGSGYPAWMGILARTVFMLMFVAAFALTKHWTYIGLGGIALVVGLIVYPIVSPDSVSPEVEIASVNKDGKSVYEAKFSANSSNTDAPIVTWNFGDGNTSNELNPKHIYKESGVYTASLSLRGEGGNADSVAMGDVEVIAKSFDITSASITQSSALAARKYPLVYNFSVKPKFGQEPYTYEWRFPSKTGAEVIYNTASGSHDFKAHGLENITTAQKVTCSFKVTDKTGQVANKTFTLTLTPFLLELKLDKLGGELPVAIEYVVNCWGANNTLKNETPMKLHIQYGDGCSGEIKLGEKMSHHFMTVDLAEGEQIKELTTSVTGTLADGSTISHEMPLRLRRAKSHHPARAAMLGGVGGMLLIGGLIICILIAKKSEEDKKKTSRTTSEE